MSESATTTSPRAGLRASTLTAGGNLGLLILRLAIGAIMLLHGSQKLFGGFGGDGLQGTAGFFGFLGLLPADFLAFVVAVVEFFGGIALILGFFARIAAIGIAIIQVVATFAFKWGMGFFETTGGWEYNLALFAAVLAIALVGVGAFSVAAVVGKRANGKIGRFVSQV